MHRPQLLVLDEATASLDPVTEQEILETLQKLSERVTILAISHQPAIRDVADVVYSLQHGVVTEVERRESPSAQAEGAASDAPYFSA